MGHRRFAVLGPSPIDARVQPIRKVPDLALGRSVSVEVLRGREHAAQQQSGVDRGQLALPGAPARLHIEKMIVEPLVPCRVGLGSLLAPPEESQRGQRALHGLGARQEPALHADRIRGERQPHRRDARRPLRAGLVAHQSVRAVGLVQKVAERTVLDRLEHARPCTVGTARPAGADSRDQIAPAADISSMLHRGSRIHRTSSCPCFSGGSAGRIAPVPAPERQGTTAEPVLLASAP